MKARYLCPVLIAVLAISQQALAFDPLLDDLPDPPTEEEKGAGGKKQVDVEDMLDVVVVTATKKEQKLGSAPAIITVITSRQIKRRGYRNVGEALRSITGLYSFNDHINYNMGVRGINGGQRAGSRIVKLMIDGQPVAFRPSSENWLGPELIPMDAISRIEIIRGPASALYGANAFLGVINIITKGGNAIDGALVRGSGLMTQGNPGGGGALVVGTKKGNFEVMVSGTGIYADRSGLTISDVPGGNRYADPATNQSKDDTAIRSSVLARASYQNETLGVLNFDFNYQRLDTHGEFVDWGPLRRGSQNPVTLDHQKNRIALDNLYARARLTKSFYENFSFNLSTAFASMGPTGSDHLAIDQVGLGDYFTRELGTNSLDLVGELTYTLKEINTFSIGVDFTSDWHKLQTFYRHDLATPDRVLPTGTEGELGDKTFTNFGALFQSVLYPFALMGTSTLDQLGVTLGVRYDRHSVYGDVPNFRLGAIYLKNKVSAKVLFGTSFKAPSSNQLFTTPLGVGSLRGNADLKPERAQTLDVMLGAQLFRGFSATVTGYYTNVNDKVEFVIDPITGDVKADNTATVTSYGLEGDLQLLHRNLSAFANVALQRSRVESDDAFRRALVDATGQSSSADANLYPTYTVKFGASYRIPQIFLGAYVEGRLIGARASSEPNAKAFDPVFNNVYNLDSFFELDAALSTHDLKLFGDRETHLMFKVSNITGSSYLAPGFRDFDIPNLGRVFYLSLSQQI